jgi:type I restriction enzyme R subunit
MTSIGQPERVTQERVIALFRDELHYRFLGDWIDRAGNSNIEEGLLTDYLLKAGYAPTQIGRALDVLRREASHHGRSLYGPARTRHAVRRFWTVGIATRFGPPSPI